MARASRFVGLVRSTKRLARAMRDLYHLKQDIEDFYRTTRLNDALIGLRHSVQAALVVAAAAQHNRVSRGCHYRDNSKPIFRTLTNDESA